MTPRFVRDRCYSPAMNPIVLEGAFTARRVEGTGSNWILEPTGGGQPRLVIAGYSGEPLPPRLTDPRLHPAGPREGNSHWRLTCAGGQHAFEARGIEMLEPRPRLFDASLAPHALRTRDRAIVSLLLKLLRLPGGAWLLRAWHVSRD